MELEYSGSFDVVACPKCMWRGLLKNKDLIYCPICFEKGDKVSVVKEDRKYPNVIFTSRGKINDSFSTNDVYTSKKKNNDIDVEYVRKDNLTLERLMSNELFVFGYPNFYLDNMHYSRVNHKWSVSILITHDYEEVVLRGSAGEFDVALSKAKMRAMKYCEENQLIDKPRSKELLRELDCMEDNDR